MFLLWMCNPHWAHICQPYLCYAIYDSVPQPTGMGIWLSAWPVLCGAPGSPSATPSCSSSSNKVRFIYELWADSRVSQWELWDKHLLTHSRQISGDRLSSLKNTSMNRNQPRCSASPPVLLKESHSVVGAQWGLWKLKPVLKRCVNLPFSNGTCVLCSGSPCRFSSGYFHLCQPSWEQKLNSSKCKCSDLVRKCCPQREEIRPYLKWNAVLSCLILCSWVRPLQLATFNFASQFAVERMSSGKWPQGNLQCGETKYKPPHEIINANKGNKA